MTDRRTATAAVLFGGQLMTDPFYKTAKWKKKRDKIMRRDGYLCQYAKRFGRMEQAEVVHHIFPRESFPQYAWEDWNLISLTRTNHNRMHDRDTHELTSVGLELMRRTAKRHRIPPPPGGA